MNRLTRLLFILALWALAFLAQGAEVSLQEIEGSSQARGKAIQAYELNPRSVQGEKLLAVAISYALETNYAKARPVYEAFLKDQPDNVRALRGLGTVFLIQKNYDSAIKYLRKSWALHDQKSLHMLALAYVAARRFHDMKDLVPTLLEHRKEDGLDNLYGLLTYAVMVRDQPLFRRALDGMPDEDVAMNEPTWFIVVSGAKLFGDNDYMIRMFEAQRRAFRRLYEKHPESWPPEYLVKVADAYAMDGQLDPASAIYERVLKPLPKNVDALRGLGTVLRASGKPNEALPKLREAWSLGDKHALKALCSTYLALEQPQGLKDLIPNLLERRKSDVELLNVLLWYSVNSVPPDKDLFFKAIAGIKNDDLASRPDTKALALQGLRLFGEDKRATALASLAPPPND